MIIGRVIAVVIFVVIIVAVIGVAVLGVGVRRRAGINTQRAGHAVVPHAQHQAEKRVHLVPAVGRVQIVQGVEALCVWQRIP